MLELSESNSHFSLNVAGDTYNTAVYLQRCMTENPVEIYYTTGLGNDAQSRKIESALTSESIHTNAIARVDNKSPGLYMISTDESGERSFSYWRDNSAARFWLESPDHKRVLGCLEKMDALYLSGISLAILPDDSRIRLLDFLADQRQSETTIIFDNNYRETLWSNREMAKGWYDQIYSLTDIALITVDDDELLYGLASSQETIARCFSQGVREVVLKQGASPCIVASDTTCLHVPAHPVAKSDIIDTTAAGDSFGAGYLAGRMKGLTLEEAARAGHLLAGTVIQYKGAIIPLRHMPTI